MKFSLIITAHNEGQTLGATIESAFRAVKFWQAKSGASKNDFEILTILDRGTEETRDCLRKYAGKVRVVESDFGDVGPARNLGAEEAQGEYVFFVDGDDLVSQEYVDRGLATLEAAEGEVVVCPEYCIGFSEDGRKGSILRMEDSGARERDAFLLFNINLWVVAIGGRRETFLRYKYIRSEGGYGHEDYAMNIMLTEAGVRHVVVPGAVYFYREKASGRRKNNDKARKVTPYSELFAPGFWRTFPAIEKQGHGGMMGRLKKLYLKVRQNKVMRQLAESIRGVMSRRIIDGLPEVVLAEWRRIAEIEPLAGQYVQVNGSGSKFRSGRRPQKKMNAMGARGVNKYCPASEAYLRVCREYEGLSGIDFEKVARGLDAEQSDLLMSRIMIQSRGEAKFLDNKCLRDWQKVHPELAKSLRVGSYFES